MIYQHIPNKLIVRLEKIEQDFIKQFSSSSAIENALLLGSSRQSHLLQSCHCQHCYFFCQTYSKLNAQSFHTCQGQFTALPYANESIDLAILPHVLEFSSEPKIIIDQVSQCLSRHGKLLLFSLSPSSQLLAVNKKIKIKPISAYATKQIILQAGLEIISSQSFFSPLSYAPKSKLMQFIDQVVTPYIPFLCNAYFIIAQKTTIPSTPMPLKSYATQKLSLALESHCSTQLGNS